MLHNKTEPRPWRGGARIIENASDDAQPLKGVDVKRQQWKEYLQADTPEHVMENNP